MGRRGGLGLILAAALGAGCGSQLLEPPFPTGDAGLAVTDAGGLDTAGTGSGVVGFIMGTWFAFGDGVGRDGRSADSDCVLEGGFGPSQCSQIAAPTPGQPFLPDPSSGAMCTSGTAAEVIPGAGGAPDTTDLWGAGIGVYFNNPGGNGSQPQTFDLSPYSGVGFEFTGDVIPASQMRVLFPFQGQARGSNSLGDPPIWTTDPAASTSPLVGNSHVTIRWADIRGPAYLAAETPPLSPPAFDPTKAYAIEFQVLTNARSATPYAFCVYNLTLLTK